MPRALLLVHALHEFLLARQIPDAFVGTLLLLLEFDDPILDLGLLVLLQLGRHNCVHHDVARFLTVNRAHAGRQILVLLLDWY